MGKLYSLSIPECPEISVVSVPFLVGLGLDEENPFLCNAQGREIVVL